MQIPDGPPSYADPHERQAIEAAQQAVSDYAFYDSRIGARCLEGSVRLSEAAYIAIMHYKMSMQKPKEAPGWREVFNVPE